MKAAWVMSQAVLLRFILLTVHLELPTAITLVLPCARKVMLIMELREMTGRVFKEVTTWKAFYFMFQQNSGVAIHNVLFHSM